MKKPRFKTHLGIGETATFCGRSVERIHGWAAKGQKPLPPEAVTTAIDKVTCRSCLEAARP